MAEIAGTYLEIVERLAREIPRPPGSPPVEIALAGESIPAKAATLATSSRNAVASPALAARRRPAALSCSRVAAGREEASASRLRQSTVRAP